MSEYGLETKIKIQQIIENQIPEFILSESPKVSEFLKQYYISQEYQGGSTDISENLDQYLKLDNLTPDIVVGKTNLSSEVLIEDTSIFVTSTKGFPKNWGLLKIDDEIITYKEKTENSFLECVRGFSGITDLHQDLNKEELVFNSTKASYHELQSEVINLSALFLQEFYQKIKYSLTPGLENIDFTEELNVGNFLKESRSLYNSKGTNESFRILFNVLYGITPKIIDLEKFLFKPSDAEYQKNEVVISDVISGNPLFLKGQTIFKSNDSTTTASITNVEIIKRGNQNYYKLFLFLGYDTTSPTITGKFDITPSTKIVDKVNIGSKVITVDSTIGFSDSGKLYCKDNKTKITYEISYTHKSINQFYGCYTNDSSFIEVELYPTSLVRTDDIYYGYENGDLNKKCEIRITGVISDIQVEESNYEFLEGEELFVNGLGDIIKNTETNPTKKQIFANSLIYNTSTRYQIESFSGSKFRVASQIDKSTLNVGDNIEFLDRNTEIVIPGLENVSVVTINNNIEVEVNVPLSSLIQTETYDIRRKIKKVNSSNLSPEIEFGNNTVIGDVQNLYSESDNNFYIASNSLPTYEIKAEIFDYKIANLSGYNTNDDNYSILEFDTNVSFVTGDKVFYSFSESPIPGLRNVDYYVEVLENKKQIRLYFSKTFISSDSEGYARFGSSAGIPQGIHRITLSSQKSRKISPQKILKKFRFNPLSSKKYNLTLPGTTGILINGVEILNYKSEDKIYYGPIDKINIINGGSDYDVISPPFVGFSSGTARIQPVIMGEVKKIFVEPQEFDIDVKVDVKIIGGNGSGAIFSPIIVRNRRELQFDAREIVFGGGIDIDQETITFSIEHKLKDGDSLIYNRNNNPELGIGTYKQSNLNQQRTLINKGSYYVKVINEKTIQLYQNISDYIAGINTIGITTVGNSGIHKFETKIRNTISEIKVIDGGSGYTNRKLIVKPTGISTFNNTINFPNHGFNTGELINYNFETTQIVGLSTFNSYFILKVDNNSFRLCNAGIGGTDKSNFERENFARLSTTGVGYQYFSYPNIELVVNYSSVGLASTSISGQIIATPQIKGKIIDAYLYEVGNDYGSTTLNYQKKPVIKVKTGSSAQFKPIISDGRIIDIKVQFSGIDYYSTPEIKIIGDGTGATARAVIVNQKVVDVIIINSGRNYTLENTSIIAVPSGSGAIFDPQIRTLTINNSYRYGVEKNFLNPYREPAGEVLIDGDYNLKYQICGYNQFVKDYFEDQSVILTHSPIIGFAYDGNPIYGPYGYIDPSDPTSGIKLMESGYEKIGALNRPSNFPLGFFVDDYKFNGNGDLDIYNGRYCKTPEFPNGIYAYFATVSNSISNNPLGQFVGIFPYFIGNYYRSDFIEDNLNIDQNNFDFNTSKLLRNTFPYKISEKNADNDFIVESNEIINQKVIIESVTTGSVDGFDILDPGVNYKVNDRLNFTNVDQYGSGLQCKVSEITGKTISNIQTEVKNYDNSIIEWNNNKLKVTINPSHIFSDGDYVTISNLPDSLSNLNGYYSIGVTTYTTKISKNIPTIISGIVTDINVIDIPENISIGSSVVIDSEKFKILNIFKLPKVLRVLNSTGSAHSIGSTVQFLPDSFEVQKTVEFFDSQVNNLIYFNPSVSLGIGTTPGSGALNEFKIGDTYYKEFIPTQSIYIPNHPFKTNQKVIFRKPSGFSAISVANTPISPSFNILNESFQELYVINKSKDFIGIVTNAGLTSTSNGLFFISAGPSVNSNLYSIESNFNQVNGNITRINSKITVETPHKLNKNDQIKLNIRPNFSVGIGTTNEVKIKYNNSTKSLLVDYLNFKSSGIDASTNTIGISSHNLNTGDKIFYTPNISPTVSAGINTGEYYVYKIDNNQIKFCSTKKDTLSIPPKSISINNKGSFNYRWFRYSIPPINPINPTSKNSFDSLFGGSFGVFQGSGIEEGIGIGWTSNTPSYIGVSTGFAWEATGYLIITEPGEYVFNTRSDDGNELQIDGIIVTSAYLERTFPGVNDLSVISNPPAGEISNPINLKIGLHTFQYRMQQGLGTSAAQVNWKKPGSTVFEQIPASNFTALPTILDQNNISLINPEIKVIKNNDLIFNLTDSSLVGYDFKIFYDDSFSEEFISDGLTSSFIVSKTGGNPGIGTQSKLTIKYSDYLPEKLYYSIENENGILNSDIDVLNYSSISYKNSIYNQNYNVYNLSQNQFNITLKEIPEQLEYTKNNCDVIEYSTTSQNSDGGIKNIKIISKGSNYKKLPKFSGSNSLNGEGAFILPKSNDSGRIKSVRIVNEGFDYSFDRTLKPFALIPILSSTKCTNTIDKIETINPGKNYQSEPNIIIINSQTGDIINSGFLKAELTGSSVSSIKIVVEPKGLPTVPVQIKTINNSNGITITRVDYSPGSGIVTCTLTTPLSGFSTSPFKIGDKVFVEGIQKIGTNGDGFNSSDYGYQFFNVDNYIQTSPGDPVKVVYNISGLTTNPGTANPIQESYATIVNSKDYPEFKVTQKFSPFFNGEKLSVNKGFGFVETDLRITKNDENFVRIIGNYEIYNDNIIKGEDSLSEATLSNIIKNNATFTTKYSSVRSFGWFKDNGKLNDDQQLIPDNDYYQNLSYTIKSPKEWEEISTNVNNILHTSGLKNFADTQIENSIIVGIATSIGKGSETTLINNFILENRVDTINNLDIVKDTNVNSNRSKFLKFKNIKLSNYTTAKTNRVLEIDDISSKFSSSGISESTFSNLYQLNPQIGYNNLLIQVKDFNSKQIQFTELITIINNNDIITLQKGSISNLEESIGEFYGYFDELDQNYYLKFEPNDKLNNDYKVKILNTEFANKNISNNSYSIGFTTFIASNVNVDPFNSVEILSIDSSVYNSFYLNVQLIGNNSIDNNYVEMYLYHDGTNVYVSDYYFDETNGPSSDFLGNFDYLIESGLIKVKFYNNEIYKILLRSKVVGIGTSTLGNGSYRFKKTTQIAGTERTVYYESRYTKNSGISTIFSLNKNDFSSIKSYIKVGYGNTTALHQILTSHDNQDSFTVQYPFLSIGSTSESTSGLGTFSGELNGNDFIIKFYPDQNVVNKNVEIFTYNQCFYSDIDLINTPNTLNYSPIRESIIATEYYGLNSNNLDTSSFPLTYNGISIFNKTFDPSDAAILDIQTGVFTIPDHFFNTGEELIYTPKSTFIGVAATSIGIGVTLLPSKIYAIKNNNNQIRVAFSRQDALNGIGITFTDRGGGNAHQFEMALKSEKSIISVNDIIQYPISFTNTKYNIQSNIDSTIKNISLTGISSIFPNDLLKIENEYVRVVNIGLSTVVSGPISAGGTIPTIEVERGFVGSSATSHIGFTTASVCRGSYNIVGSRIFFTDSPTGIVAPNLYGLPKEKSSFNGKVFLRRDYTTNNIYDNISDKFTGIGNTYVITKNGSNIVGIGTSGENGILVINGIFQTPTTLNNSNNNYSIVESGGKTEIVFSGIKDPFNDNQIISNYDINQNKLPRGGLIVSLGSTSGLGYAPLVGASATAIINGSGSIIGIAVSNFGSGYRYPVSIGITDISSPTSSANIIATVGAGGTLSFNIQNGGIGYTKPTLQIPSPNYENLEVIGVSRIGIGSTTITGTGLKLNLDVGPSSSVGIGSTLFSVNSFKITRPGYGFRIGDVIKAVGLVTAKGFSNPLEEFQLTVIDVFNDSFAMWQFGEMNYIDSIKTLQNGIRTRFPLYYNGQLLSFEKDNSPDSQLIDFDSLLLVFVNGIVQTPKVSYQFDGGTSFTFTEAPKQEDDISIFFYLGTRNQDSEIVDNITPILEIGDSVQVYSNNDNIENTITQDPRSVQVISGSDTIETNLYGDQGIDDENFKPLYWTKKKRDSIINGDIIPKTRNSLISQVYPTAKIISNLTNSLSATEVFVDNAKLFNSDISVGDKFDCLIIPDSNDPISGIVTATVSAAGTIQSLNIINSGFGYTGTSVIAKFSAPPTSNGITASASISVSSGILTTPIVITNPGSGYTSTNPPQVIIPLPDLNYELIKNVTTTNFNGSVVGIASTTGIGTTKAIRFTLDPIQAINLQVGYPIYIFDTRVGNGVTSIISNISNKVGIGTTFLDNIYYINAINTTTGIITCNVSFDTTIVGINTTGTIKYPVGRFSCSRLSGFTRSSNPISIGVSGNIVNSGLTTFPTIQRRNYGLRQTGSLKEN